MSALLVIAAPARADRPFAIRFTTNDFGSVAFAANTLMTCPDSASTCAAARQGLQGGALGNNNDGYAMSYVVVKRNIKLSRDGHFRATVAAPAGAGVAYYRALTRVRKTTRNPKTYETFTLLRGVTVRPA